MKIRKISPSFVDDLKKEKGVLHWFYQRVISPNSGLSLEIRADYINIYYNGGSLLRIQEDGEHHYIFKFDEKYGIRKNGQREVEGGRVIKDKKGKEILWDKSMAKNYEQIHNINIDTAKQLFDTLIDMMDGWFSEHQKAERDYQHKISLPENNKNVLDIEYTISNSGMRLDMIMVDDKGDLNIIENKYGNNSIYSYVSDKSKRKIENPEFSNPGLSKHYKDFLKLIGNAYYKNNLVASMKSILNVKQKLEILPNDIFIKKDPDFRFVFVLADLNKNIKNIRKAENVIHKLVYESNEIERSLIKEYSPRLLLTCSDEYTIKLNETKDFIGYDFERFFGLK
ncbi:hypothetical protein [Butyrivibrio fibrisolvens]|uniref:hypothetical protein n=1 Tax=Butyrivibrio fibrisolvens TaxID=831 RepID=UPI00041AB667|nr:hypothetical protein [Butyrivibrio fibrisolvens]